MIADWEQLGVVPKVNETQTGEDSIALPDPTAMAIALDRSVGTAWSAHYLEVETLSDLTRGMTIVDRLIVAQDANNRGVWAPASANGPKTDVCWTLDTARFKVMLMRALG
jgi:purine nucleosidase